MGRNERNEHTTITVFGQHLSKLLREKKMTLRELARQTGIDASNLSKMERGVAYPPQKLDTLEKIATAFDLADDPKQQFFDLANLVNGMLPEDTESLKENEAVPLLLRAINNRQLTKDEVEELANIIRDENRWQGRVVD